MSELFDAEVKHTARGFRFYDFVDRNGNECTIQKSSIATENAIWLGLESASPKILHGDATKLGIEHDEISGWVDYPIPEEVILNTRMHLTQEQAMQLGEMLIYFAKSGELPRLSVASGTRADSWIDTEDKWPERVCGNKIWCFYDGLQFESECDEDLIWCNIYGNPFTHWMSLPTAPARK